MNNNHADVGNGKIDYLKDFTLEWKTLLLFTFLKQYNEQFIKKLVIIN